MAGRVEDIEREDMIRPTRGRVLVEPISDMRLTKGGIWVAKTKKEKYHKGRVLAVGGPPLDKWGKERSFPYKAGDVAHFKTYSFKKWRETGSQLRVFLKDEDIVGYEHNGDLHAVRDMVIVRLEYAEKEGSIIIPDKAKRYSADFKGVIISVGPEYKYGLQAGDSIAYLRHEGFEIETENGKYLAIKEKWIAGKREE